MYLIDTNILLELLLEQQKANDVRQFFSTVRTSRMSLTDLSLHSIGIILIGLKRNEVFAKFVVDIRDGEIEILSLDLGDMASVIRIVEEFDLDFDNAYQYSVSEKYDMQIVSFDKDFDRTERGRKEPKDIEL